MESLSVEATSEGAHAVVLVVIISLRTLTYIFFACFIWLSYGGSWWARGKICNLLLSAVLLWLCGNDSLFWMFRSRIVGVPDLLSVEPQALNQLFI